VIAQNTTLVLSTDSDLFKFLSSMNPAGSGFDVQQRAAVSR
jgi:hypothetical protein